MTAQTMPAQPAEDTTPGPLPWRRMGGVIWRQHRFALVTVATLLGALAVYLWIVGSSLHNAYAAAIACHPAGLPACQAVVNNFNGLGSFLSNGVILQVLPAAIGAFVGAPLLAREMETGTFRYAWTQGFGRRRWTLAKLVALGLAVTVAAGLFSLLLGWYYQPYLATGNSALAINELSPFNSGLFDLGRVTFAGWTLAAFAIGALAGMLIRRVVTALAATLAVYTGLALAVGLYLREHYLTPLLVKNASPPASAWVIGQQWYARGGQPVSQSTLGQVLQTAPQLAGGKGGIPQDDPTVNQYLVQHGYTLWTTYQPGSRFWPFQWIEGGWLLALSVLLIAATVWLVRRRAA